MPKHLIFAFLLSLVASLPALAQPTVYPSSFRVAQDGSGDFRTIQDAVNAVRDLSQQQVKIFIKNGVYQEKLVIPSWKARISLIGESPEGTIITNNDHTGKPYPGGSDLMGKDKFGTFTSYTVLVQGDDFVAENLTIQNTAGPVGQAVALHVEGDRAVFRNCRLLSHQDTLYAATPTSRQLYQDCYIEGTTDFIFGEATVVFQRCVIKSLKNSYITAAATSPGQKYGFVFLNCRLIADPEAKEVFLGRPWRPNAKTVFIDTEMGTHIRPEGWDNWRNPENEKTVLYAEYRSTGLGAQPQGRVGWSRQLTQKQAKAYTLNKIFPGENWWNPTAE